MDNTELLVTPTTQAHQGPRRIAAKAVPIISKNSTRLSAGATTPPTRLIATQTQSRRISRDCFILVVADLIDAPQEGSARERPSSRSLRAHSNCAKATE